MVPTTISGEAHGAQLALKITWKWRGAVRLITSFLILQNHPLWAKFCLTAQRMRKTLWYSVSEIFTMKRYTWGLIIFSSEIIDRSLQMPDSSRKATQGIGDCKERTEQNKLYHQIINPHGTFWTQHRCFVVQRDIKQCQNKMMLTILTETLQFGNRGN